MGLRAKGAAPSNNDPLVFIVTLFFVSSPCQKFVRGVLLSFSLGVLVGGCAKESNDQEVDGVEGRKDSPASAIDETFREIDLDGFIEQEISAFEHVKGQRLIRMAAPVRFEASVKRHPEEKELTYIYTAFEVAGVSPLPEVRHRMFVESREGRIIPVYVENQAASRLANDLDEGQSATFLGYHAYSYSKGPALMVADFRPLPQ